MKSRPNFVNLYVPPKWQDEHGTLYLRAQAGIAFPVVGMIVKIIATIGASAKLMSRPDLQFIRVPPFAVGCLAVIFCPEVCRL
jgi:hypothetical protein